MWVGNAYVNVQGESNDTIQAAVARAGMNYETLSSASAIITKINDGTLANHTRWWWGGTDSASHHYGPESPQYASAIQSMSSSIGQIMTALQNSTSGIDIGNTVLGLGSDHGHQPLVPFASTAPDPSCLDGTPEDCRVIDARYVVEQAGIVVETWRASGPRMAHVYLDDPADAPAAKAALEARTGVHRAFTKQELDATDLSAITPDVFALPEPSQLGRRDRVRRSRVLHGTLRDLRSGAGPRREQLLLGLLGRLQGRPRWHHFWRHVHPVRPVGRCNRSGLQSWSKTECGLGSHGYRVARDRSAARRRGFGSLGVPALQGRRRGRVHPLRRWTATTVIPTSTQVRWSCATAWTTTATA